MNPLLIELLKNIESLSDDDLERVKTWIEFNLSKRAAQASNK